MKAKAVEISKKFWREAVVSLFGIGLTAFIANANNNLATKIEGNHKLAMSEIDNKVALLQQQNIMQAKIVQIQNKNTQVHMLRLVKMIDTLEQRFNKREN